jgi:hypothetical protein
MGEFALYRGERIKIGTCEDLYYLRADQAPSVGRQSGNVDPMSPDHRKSIRFRFPWPDEDGTEPGAFDRYDRAVGVPGSEVTVPAGVEHYSIQFSSAHGYLLSLPCPEGAPGVTPGLSTMVGDIKIARNGFGGAVQVVQQAYRNGNLALICQCGGCGARYNLPTFADAEPVIVAFRAEADRRARTGESATWYHAVADRIAAGYDMVNVEVAP